MASPRVILLTDRAHADLTFGDQMYAASLRERGADVRPVVWDDPDWELEGDGDIVVVRSTWDTNDDPERWAQFAEFITNLDQHPGIVHNRPDILKWDLDKESWSDLASSGLQMPKTIVIDDPDQAGAVVADEGWSRAVLKPTIGGSGYGVTLIGPAGPPPDLTRSMGRWFVQEFLPEIADGELNVVLIDGEVSHMVRKKPAEGEFRSNWAFGPTWTAEPPPRPAVEAALRTAAHFGEPPHYMRVDGVMVGDEFRLIECEVTAPSLFFHLAPDAADRMAEATLATLD